MATSASKALRSAIAQELRDLGSLLEAQRICLDTSPLWRASSLCQGRTDERWGYSISSLMLEVGEDVRCIPTHLRSFSCRVDVDVEGDCAPIADHADPLSRHQVNIVLKAGVTDPEKPAFLQ